MSEPLDVHGMSRIFPYVGLALVVFSNVAASLLLKIGAESERTLLGLFNGPTIIGALCFILAFFFYYWSLRYVPLHLAQIAVSAQFAAIIVAAALILGETITPMRWAGVVVIVLGIAIASQS